MRASRLVGLLAAALAASVIAVAAPGASAFQSKDAVDRPGPIARGDDGDARPVVGWSPAEIPDIDWLDGRERTLASLAGRVLVIRSFTDTCPFCAASMPALENLHRDFAARGLAVLGVYHPKPPRTVASADVAGFARSLGVTFPIGIDPGWRLVESWWLGRTQSDWTSVTWILDRKGVVRHVHPGGEYHPDGGPRHGRCRDDEREIRAVVERLLAEPEPRGSAASVVEAVETALRDQMAEAKTPGAAFAVVRDGTIIAARGLGMTKAGGSDRVTADTLFMIGSVTKPLTAAAILRADEAGTLDLDRPIGRVVTGLDPRVAALTPRQLVSQTSGLGDLPGAMGTKDEGALLAFARALGPRQFVAPPGAVFSYSNPGLALAGAALAAARRERYADAMRALLFEPLGMTRTTLRPAEAEKQARASGHDARGGPLADYDLDTRLAPAGYAWSTASDLAAFARDWLAAHEGSGRVLSRRTARLMATKASDFPPTFDGTGYGLGLFVEDRRRVRVLHHAGEVTGFSAQIALVPERRFGLVVLVNGDGVVLTKTIDAALRAVAGVPPLAGEPLLAGEPVSEDEARSLAGRYLNRWPLELSWADGALRLRFGGSVREVRRLGAGRYVAGSPDEAGSAAGSPAPAIELRVGRGADGTVYLRQFLWTFGRDFLPADAPELDAASISKE